MIDGLDRRDRIQPDPFVGAVQSLVVDAEPGGGRDAEPGEVVADVGRPGDLRRRAQPRGGGGAQAGQRVVIWTWVGWVPGQAVSAEAAREPSRSAAAVASNAGVSRTSTLKVHRSGTVEYPSPPLTAVSR